MQRRSFLSTPSARRATLQCIVDGCSGGHFYPRPPRGGRLEQPYKKCEACKISIHALREEGDLYKCRLRHVLVSISIHALREEGDYFAIHSPGEVEQFLSTPSARRATCFGATLSTGQANFYPRPPRGGRRQSDCRSAYKSYISIHALREEGDYFAIHSPGEVEQFLSTPSARRATGRRGRQSPCPAHFYPRPPRGGRPDKPYAEQLKDKISIHALREEGDNGRPTVVKSPINFYPRPPRGGRQIAARCLLPEFSISIHALREEGDAAYSDNIAVFFDFYPRPPRGGRRARTSEIQFFFEFLSTPSARRATNAIADVLLCFAISIHALREEGDEETPFTLRLLDISIHALREEGDCKAPDLEGTEEKFLSTPSARRATESVLMILP